MHAKVSVTESQFPGILAEILVPKLLLKHKFVSWVTQELMKMFLWNVTGSSDSKSDTQSLGHDCPEGVMVKCLSC